MGDAISHVNGAPGGPVQDRTPTRSEDMGKPNLSAPSRVLHGTRFRQCAQTLRWEDEPGGSQHDRCRYRNVKICIPFSFFFFSSLMPNVGRHLTTAAEMQKCGRHSNSSSLVQLNRAHETWRRLSRMPRRTKSMDA